MPSATDVVASGDSVSFVGHTTHAFGRNWTTRSSDGTPTICDRPSAFGAGYTPHLRVRLGARKWRGASARSDSITPPNHRALLLRCHSDESHLSTCTPSC